VRTASRPLPEPRADSATLRAFVAVARLGTVGRAALALGRTQPSVSARLASLERAWQVRLFRRVARGMTLTPEGARLLPRAEAALATLEELDREAGLPVSAPDLLRIGSGDALGRVVLPRALKELARERTGLTVRVLEGSGSSLLAALGAGAIDIALVALGGASLADDAIETGLVLESPIELLAPPRRRIPARPIDALVQGPVIALQPESAFRRHLEGALAALRVPFRPAVEVGNLSLVRRFVSAGLGVAAVPAVAFERHAPGPAVRRVALPAIPPLRYHRASRAGVPLPEAALRLLQLLGPGPRKRREDREPSR
jgi:DNA-binding transcriptional LysR family regulator